MWVLNTPSQVGYEPVFCKEFLLNQVSTLSVSGGGFVKTCDSCFIEWVILLSRKWRRGRHFDGVLPGGVCWHSRRDWGFFCAIGRQIVAARCSIWASWIVDHLISTLWGPLCLWRVFVLLCCLRWPVLGSVVCGPFLRGRCEWGWLVCIRSKGWQVWLPMLRTTDPWDPKCNRPNVVGKDKGYCC